VSIEMREMDLVLEKGLMGLMDGDTWSSQSKRGPRKKAWKTAEDEGEAEGGE